MAILAIKNHFRCSLRGLPFFSDVLDLSRKLAFAPSKNSIISYAADPRTTGYIDEAFALTVDPFCALEEDIIIDSSGISSLYFTNWRPIAESEERESCSPKWLKLHIAIGRISKAVLAFVITPSSGPGTGDSSMFAPLVRKILELGILPRYLIADNIYLTEKVTKFTQSIGVPLVTPFKNKNRDRDGNVRGIAASVVEEFRRIDPDLYDSLIRGRSPIEGVFSVKKRHESRVRAIGNAQERLAFRSGERKDSLFVSRVNEVCSRVVAYNLTCINREEYRRGLSRLDLSRGERFPVESRGEK